MPLMVPEGAAPIPPTGTLAALPWKGKKRKEKIPPIILEGANGPVLVRGLFGIPGGKRL